MVSTEGSQAPLVQLQVNSCVVGQEMPFDFEVVGLTSGALVEARVVPDWPPEDPPLQAISDKTRVIARIRFRNSMGRRPRSKVRIEI